MATDINALNMVMNQHQDGMGSMGTGGSTGSNFLSENWAGMDNLKGQGHGIIGNLNFLGKNMSKASIALSVDPANMGQMQIQPTPGVTALGKSASLFSSKG